MDMTAASVSGFTVQIDVLWCVSMFVTQQSRIMLGGGGLIWVLRALLSLVH